jgi:TonB family protein
MSIYSVGADGAPWSADDTSGAKNDTIVKFRPCTVAGLTAARARGETTALRRRLAAVALMLLLGSGCATVGTAPYVLDTQPRSLEYPPEAKRLGLSGNVDMKVMLGEDGAVKNITFVQAAGNGFDEAASDYVRRTKYAPARMPDGRAVPAEFRVKIKFTPGGVVTGKP